MVGGTNLSLPRNRDRAGVETTVERVVRCVQIDALYRRELLYVQHVLSVHRMRLKTKIWIRNSLVFLIIEINLHQD